VFDDPEDLNRFKLIVTPDKDSMWYGGRYQFQFKVPTDYPFDPPKAHCNTKVRRRVVTLDFPSEYRFQWERMPEHPKVRLEPCSRHQHGCVRNHYSLPGKPRYTNTKDPRGEDPLNYKAADLMMESMKEFRSVVRKTLRGMSLWGEKFDRFIK